MSSDPTIVGYAAGATSIGYIVAALFFLKFWRRTRDSLFVSFAAAFVLMAINQAAPALFGIPDEMVSNVYLLRLAAFLLIIFAILRKNMKDG
jgi:membrane-associated PAP2 superfamily phosphatase